MLIFLFYVKVYIFQNKEIDELCKNYTKQQIINICNNDEINWKIKEHFERSINYMKQIENECKHEVVKCSLYILENYKTQNYL